MSIKVISVTKKYSPKTGIKRQTITAVKNLSIDINEGSFIVISGPTGSGKSTLLALLSGIMKPTQGDIVFNNIHLKSSSDEKISRFREKFIGFIPQNVILNSNMNIFENIIAPNGFIKQSLKHLKKETEKVLERLELLDKKDWFPPELSGGERKKVMIARALIKNPLFILADEPVSELDPESTKNVLGLFNEYHRNGSGIVIATHSKIDVGKKADYYIMRNGEIFLQKNRQ